MKNTLLQENFDLTIKFDLFWPNNLGVAHGISVKFGLWTFHKLWKGRKFLTSLTWVALVITHLHSGGTSPIFIWGDNSQELSAHIHWRRTWITSAAVTRNCCDVYKFNELRSRPLQHKAIGGRNSKSLPLEKKLLQSSFAAAAAAAAALRCPWPCNVSVSVLVLPLRSRR